MALPAGRPATIHDERRPARGASSRPASDGGVVAGLRSGNG